MADGSVLLSYLCLLCLLDQAGAAREVTTLNYPLVKDQRIRVRRYDLRYVDECTKKNGVIHKTATSTSDGFSKLTKDDYVVQFVNDNGSFSVNVSWQAPQGVNNSSPDGYWFSWYAYRPDKNDQVHSYSFVCTVLSGEKTWFVVNESPYWRKDEYITLAICPLPKNSKTIDKSCFTSGPAFIPPRFDDSPSELPKVNTQSSTSTSTHAFAELASSERSSSRSTKVIRLAYAKKKQNKEELLTFIVVAISCTVLISLIGFILALRYRKKRRQAEPDVPRDPGYIYVSYIPESEGHIEKVVDFSSWLRKHGYNVQMDIMSTSNNLEDLKELGRLRWGEKQLLRAKNVFLIVSPSYLNLCRLDERKTDASPLTQEETNVYSEITQIRSELSSTAYISSRFIPVLFGVKETDLPFWIKQRVVYKWPDDKMNNKLLYRMNDEVSYENDQRDRDIGNATGVKACNG